LHGETVDVVKSTLSTLLGAVGLLLLIACANVANLFLARGTDRAREFAVRAALGAGRRRIVRQLLTECVLLALVGGALGVGLAIFGVRAFVAFDPGSVPRLGDVGVDARVLAFALVMATATGILFGLVPAFRTARKNLSDTIREGSNLMSGRGRNRLRSMFVVAQTALALMLTTGAGLVLNSFIRLHRVDPGFDPEGVLAMEVFLAGDDNHEMPETRLRFFQELEDRIAAIPNVTTAGAASMRPFGGPYLKATIYAEGVAAPEDQIRLTGVHYASSGYFDAMGIPLLRGSGLPADGGPAATTDIVVNEEIARTHWPDQDPIGKRLRFSTDIVVNEEIARTHWPAPGIGWWVLWAMSRIDPWNAAIFPRSTFLS
jgi:predicted permease